MTKDEAIATLTEALTRLRNECDLDGLRAKAGFDCWLNNADKALLAAATTAPSSEPVAEICSGFALHYIGSEPIAAIFARHPGLKIGSKLYAEAPAAPVVVQSDPNRPDILDAIADAESEAMKSKLRKLVYAASAVIERWDSPNWKDQAHTGEFIHRLRAATAEASANSAAPVDPIVVPEGFALVPTEPTDAMIKRAWVYGNWQKGDAPDPVYAYKAMISAAPAAPLNTAAPTEGE